MRPLHITPEEFHAAATRILELSEKWLFDFDERRIVPDARGAETEALFDHDFPEEGLRLAGLDGIDEVVAKSRAQNGRFYGYVLGSGEPIAALADLLASVLNQNVTAWRSAPAAASMERALVRRLVHALGLLGYQGSLCGGGSAANLMGLAMAREHRLSANQDGGAAGTVYASAEVHMSIPKAMALLGLGRANLREIPVDAEFRIRPDLLREAIRKDLASGLKPVAVVGYAGTVKTGAIDPLEELAAIAKEHGLWFHVDGAYGGFGALAVPEKFSGMERADSLSLDPHKWLYQPVDCGMFLYRDSTLAERTFSLSGDYVKPASLDAVEGFAFFDESIELSRRFRALKLWLSIRFHGLGAFRAAIRRDLEHAQLLAKRVRETPQLELTAPVPLSVVCFRYRAPEGVDGNAFNRELLARVLARGTVYLSNANIGPSFCLRACFTNHRTVAADVEQVIPEVLAAARELG